MAQSAEWKKAYQAGYLAGANRHSWPEHRPPFPPHKYVRRLMEAALTLRDEADNICATLDEKDDFVKRLSPAIDAVDASHIEITRWLKEING